MKSDDEPSFWRRRCVHHFSWSGLRGQLMSDASITSIRRIVVPASASGMERFARAVNVRNPPGRQVRRSDAGTKRMSILGWERTCGNAAIGAHDDVRQMSVPALSGHSPTSQLAAVVACKTDIHTLPCSSRINRTGREYTHDRGLTSGQ